MPTKEVALQIDKHAELVTCLLVSDNVLINLLEADILSAIGANITYHKGQITVTDQMSPQVLNIMLADGFIEKNDQQRHFICQYQTNCALLTDMT